jgi:hypothetical protein
MERLCIVLVLLLSVFAPARESQAAEKSWAAKQTDTHAKLEALWTTWGLNAVNESLLREFLSSTDHRARAPAARSTAAR